MNALAAEKTISFDTETSGLLETDRPFALALATSNAQFYLDRRVLTDPYFKHVISLLEEKDKDLIGQNIKFDLRMMHAQWGFTPKGCLKDTEILGRLVKNDHLSYGLDAQAKRYGMEKSKEVEEYITKHKLYTQTQSKYKTKKVKRLHFDEVPMDIMGRYALQDARITYDLHEKLIMDLDPISYPIWTMEQALTPICFQMERTGIKVDVPYTERALCYEESLIREAKSQFLLATGKQYDNSKALLVEVFIAAGEVIKKTDKGNDQLTDDDLEKFTSPAAKIVQKIRFHEKRVSTYYSSFMELKDDQDIIHPDMRQAGTTTGRFSYREPNLQNVPKEDGSKDAFVVRGCFRPREGNIFVSMDFKQQEYRLMLSYANHRKLICEVMDGADVHQATADLVGVSRNVAKTLNFAILYGAGADKLSGMLGISKSESSELRNRYFNSIIEVEDLIFNITKKGQGRGYVYNWLGRKLNRTIVSTSKGTVDFAYKLPNHLIQGGGADICKTAMVRCAEILQGYDTKMMLQIHDAIVFEGPKKELEELAPGLKKAMIESWPIKNGMAMDIDIAWSDKSLAERDMKPWDQK